MCQFGSLRLMLLDRDKELGLLSGLLAGVRRVLARAFWSGSVSGVATTRRMFISGFVTIC